MLAVDLHVHSQFSSCGLHTILELLVTADAQRVGEFIRMRKRFKK